MIDREKVAVTIITGFLGSGKTTLLNEILKSSKDRDFLIIENEVGNINIDKELVEERFKNNLFELTGGCICCSLSKELGSVLNSIISSEKKYDYLLIEATGMADPTQIINTFSSPQIERYFKLDSVVALVDSESFHKRLKDFSEVTSQIVKSDIVVINKCDLISPAEIELVESRIGDINPLARVEKTRFGKLDGIEILDSDSFNPANIESGLINLTKPKFIAVDNRDTHKVEVLSYIIAGDFDIDRFSIWFEKFLQDKGDDVVRVKGVVSLDGMDHRMVLQSVGGDYYVTRGSKWIDSDIRESKVVIIGRGLDRVWIEKELHRLLVM